MKRNDSMLKVFWLVSCGVKPFQKILYCSFCKNWLAQNILFNTFLVWLQLTELFWQHFVLFHLNCQCFCYEIFVNFFINIPVVFFLTCTPSYFRCKNLNLMFFTIMFYHVNNIHLRICWSENNSFFALIWRNNIFLF